MPPTTIHSAKDEVGNIQRRGGIKSNALSSASFAFFSPSKFLASDGKGVIAVIVCVWVCQIDSNSIFDV